MAKRKRTDVVKLQLRIRETLRRRLEAAARADERSLNSEIAQRLEDSFDQEKNSLLLEALLAHGAGLELLRAVAIIVRTAGVGWLYPPKSHVVSEAITKFIAVLGGELEPLEPIENKFPNRNEKDSVDQLVWPAILVGQWPRFVSIERARRKLEEARKLAGNVS
jgi:hypothetical protein